MSWKIEKSDWPWNSEYGQNQTIVIKPKNEDEIRLSCVEIIECLGYKYVQAHLNTCLKSLKNFKNT